MSDWRERQISDLLASLDEARGGDPSSPGSASEEALARPGASRDLRALAQLQAALRSLPDVEPDPASWQRIRARSEARAGPRVAAEGRAAGSTRGATREPWRLPARVAGPLALAAGLLLVVIAGVLTLDPARDQVFDPALPQVAGSGIDEESLQALFRRSQQLEPLVYGMRPGRANASERAMLYRIADLDAQLARSSETLRPEEVRRMWGQRVTLLESLAQVRRTRASLQPAVY